MSIKRNRRATYGYDNGDQDDPAAGINVSLQKKRGLAVSTALAV